VDATDFEGLDLLAPHWAYSVHPKDADQDIIVVDGKPVTGYSGFGGFLLSPSGRHYAFAVTKIGQDADTPMIVVDGKEYVGENPSTARVGSQEYFFWTIQDGEKTTLRSLALSP